MSADVIPLIRPEAIDAAWERFAEHASKAVYNPRLTIDREYMQKHAKLHDHWRRVYLRSQG